MTMRFIMATAAPVPFDFEDPRPDMIDPRAVAKHLAFEPRWSGNLHWHYSVAQHSLLVAQAISDPRWRVYGLLHDAAEMFTRDLATNFKHWLVSQGADVLALERRILEAVWTRFNLPTPSLEIAHAVDIADQRALATEWRDVVYGRAVSGWDWQPKGQPLPVAIKARGALEVETEWLEALDSYLYLAREAA